MKGERNPVKTQASYARLIKAGFIAKVPPPAAARPQPVKCAPSPSCLKAAPKPFVVPQGVTVAPASYVGGVPGASCR